MKLLQYFKNLLIAVDQLVNALIGGDPDETLSSHAWRCSTKYWYAEALRKIIDVLMYLPEGCEWGHCKASYLSECAKRHDKKWQAALDEK